jgi:hypothetical protein
LEEEERGDTLERRGEKRRRGGKKARVPTTTLAKRSRLK